MGSCQIMYQRLIAEYWRAPAWSSASALVFRMYISNCILALVLQNVHI